MIVPVTPSQALDIDVLPPGLGSARHPGRLTACRTEAASLSLRTQARIQARISWPAQSVAADSDGRRRASRSESRSSRPISESRSRVRGSPAAAAMLRLVTATVSLPQSLSYGHWS
jgi:hypothetical protein